MKFTKVLCFILVPITVLLSGCFKTTSYPFHYDESEIESISIIHTLDDYGYKSYVYETLLKIEDINEFLTKFKEIQFRSFQFGDPSEVGPDINAILIKYFNGDFEIISYDTHDTIIDGEPWCYGRPNCNKEEFENFINSYLSLEN